MKILQPEWSQEVFFSFNKMDPALLVLMCLSPWTDRDLSISQT